MNTQEITRLLEKYYRGESTEDEELTLKNIFISENVPEEFAVEKEIFRYYSDSLEIPDPSIEFEKKIIAAIDNSESNAGIRNSSRMLMTILSAAAGLFLVICSYFLFARKTVPRDTFSNPEIAYAETVKILYEVSAQLNRGTEALEPVRKFGDVTAKTYASINKSTTLIENNLRNLDYFQKAINMVHSPMKININK